LLQNFPHIIRLPYKKSAVSFLRIFFDAYKENRINKKTILTKILITLIEDITKVGDHFFGGGAGEDLRRFIRPPSAPPVAADLGRGNGSAPLWFQE